MMHSLERQMNVLENTLYIHVGTDKTGSTALQGFCHANSDKLYTRGLIYLTNGRKKSHKGTLLPHHDLLMDQVRNNDYSGWKAVGRELHQAECCSGLVSFEGFIIFLVSNCKK